MRMQEGQLAGWRYHAGDLAVQEGRVFDRTRND